MGKRLGVLSTAIAIAALVLGAAIPAEGSSGHTAEGEVHVRPVSSTEGVLTFQLEG
jgi:hypothetical protein